MPLLLALLLLGACGGRETGKQPEQLVIGQPQVSTEKEPGYLTTELPMRSGYRNFGGLQSCGNSLYLHAEMENGGFAVLRYDTLNGEWTDWLLNTGEAKYPRIEAFSAAEGAVWLRLMEGYSEEEILRRDFSRRLDYYLLVLDTESGAQRCTRIDFWRNGNDSDPYLTGLVALDRERALLNDDETVRLISPDARVLQTLDLPLMGFPTVAWIGEGMYLSTGAGICPFDPESLRCGEPLEGLLWEPVYSSQRGRILVTKERVLREYDPETGETHPVFDWMDVALNYASLEGYGAFYGLENANGDLFYLANGKLTKVSPTMVPVKKPLVLGCFADASAQGYEYSDTEYTCPERLLDAIMRFNQSDPEYRVVLKPMVWHDEAERNRLLLQLATESSIDALDTSLLPPGAVDRELLVDLLPYIDEDPDVSREDFIPGLFAALTQNGGLYEYSDRFTLLTLLCAEHLGLSRENWTPERAAQVLSREEAAPSMSREQLLLLFSWAATAEFMDRTAGSCSFDSPLFLGWLELLRHIPADTSAYNPGGDWLISCDFAADAGYMPRMRFRDEAAILGFPGAAGSGSYFMKLLPADGMGHSGQLMLEEGMLWTAGCNTSLGMMASSENKDGAWRFVKTFLLGEEDPYLTDGIPILRAAFERAVENSLRRPQSNVNDYASFNEKDAAAMRELVYGTERMVLGDEAVIGILKTELGAFLDGRQTAEATAALLQSKLSLYLSDTTAEGKKHASAVGATLAVARRSAPEQHRGPPRASAPTQKCASRRRGGGLPRPAPRPCLTRPPPGKSAPGFPKHVIARRQSRRGNPSLLSLCWGLACGILLHPFSPILLRRAVLFGQSVLS